MRITPIRNKREHERALKRIEALWDSPPGTAGYDELEVLSILVEHYEDRHQPILPPNPRDAILFRMEQLGLTRKDLEKFLGTRARVSEVLSGRRALSTSMVRRLRDGLMIPADALI